jgi:hypothetical protein
MIVVPTTEGIALNRQWYPIRAVNRETPPRPRHAGQHNPGDPVWLVSAEDTDILGNVQKLTRPGPELE